MPPKNRHTFLFEEGLWAARGQYLDAAGFIMPCDGEARVSHQPELWINEGYMRLLLSEPVVYENRYEIAPFPEDGDMTEWTSHNPSLDVLRGRFVIVGDSIISPWRSENGEYWGTEFLIQTGEYTYQSRGFACHGDQKLSSWAVELNFSR